MNVNKLFVNYRILNEYLHLPEYQNLVSLLEKGVGIHHSGMIPILREIVELMISKKYIKLLFATESFAIGLDCPIKTAVFTGVNKFDGRCERFLMSHEYTQMAGRAGRRGIDTIGHVVHCNNLFSTPSIGEYQSIMGGVPQKLVSKFCISYSLILNLLKNGQTKDFHLFSQKSMIQSEIEKSIHNFELSTQTTLQQITEKEQFVQNARTPHDICTKYIELTHLRNTSNNKKRKNADKELFQLTDQHRYIKDDVKRVIDFNSLQEQLEIDKSSLEYTKDFIMNQTQKVCNALQTYNFINFDKNTDEYQLTELGVIASNIAEIHPLVVCKFLDKWNYFQDFTTFQVVGLFSCFTDVKVSDDVKLSVPNTTDYLLLSSIKDIDNLNKEYQSYEHDYEINSGIHYDNALQFDIIDISMKWCNCETIDECKLLIQTDLYEKSISVGDFTKAILKIATIVREWMSVFEIIGNIEALHKFNQIENLLLKYITTSQSLYV